MTHIVKLFGADCFSPRFDFGLLVQNHVQQGFMDFEFSVVFDKTQLAEFVHEEFSASFSRTLPLLPRVSLQVRVVIGPRCSVPK
jgi:hypothetical protein